MKTGSNSKVRFHALDGWRGICAVLVALFHVEVLNSIHWLPMVRNAWLFVDFFFVLSGFVITHADGERISSPSGLGHFVARRFGRLWPLHMTVLGALIVLEILRAAAQTRIGSGGMRPAFSENHSLGSIITNLLLIQSLGTESVLTWNAPAWSISTEFYTYLVFGAACLLAVKRQIRVALKLALGLSGLLVLVVYPPHNMNQTFGLSIFRCFYGFFFGSLVYQAWRSGWSKHLRGTLPELVTVGMVAVFLFAVDTHPAATFLAPPLFGVVVLVFAESSGRLSRALTAPLVAALGLWSYSIYMIHDFVLAVFFDGVSVIDRFTHAGWISHQHGFAVIEFGSEAGNSIFALIYIAAVIVLASMTWRWIEVPGQNLVRGIFGRSKFVGCPLEANLRK